MNFAGLVERLVPQVAELFATLATRDPLRMYFADIADRPAFNEFHDTSIIVAGMNLSPHLRNELVALSQFSQRPS